MQTKNFYHITIFVFLILSAERLSFGGEIDAAKQNEIDRLSQFIFPQADADRRYRMIETFRSVAKDVPKDVFNEAVKNIKKPSSKGILYSILDKDFSLEEIKSLNAFYSSPVSKKFQGKMPLILQAQNIAQIKEDNEILVQISKNLEANGYKIDKLKEFLEHMNAATAGKDNPGAFIKRPALAPSVLSGKPSEK